ncbi:MAG: triose-phosphate isomerase [Candidatus Moraniibacteriota bacterium]
MRPFYIVGNIKMNLLSKVECEKYVALFRRELSGKGFVYSAGVVCPPTIHLSRFTHLPPEIKLGAQDVSWERSGAFTGETSPLMLKDTGVEYVIIGHSERRGIFGETDEMVALKTETLLKHLLTPIVCIGETKEERSREMTVDVLKRQIEAIFKGLSPMQAEKVILAYEPRWAIGTDEHPTTQDILQIKIFLRKLFTELYDARLAERIIVLYGGSVKSMNLKEVSWEAEMDGVLVGRESLFPHELVKMMEMGEEYRKGAH